MRVLNTPKAVGINQMSFNAANVVRSVRCNAGAGDGESAAVPKRRSPPKKAAPSEAAAAAPPAPPPALSLDWNALYNDQAPAAPAPATASEDAIAEGYEGAAHAEPEPAKPKPGRKKAAAAAAGPLIAELGQVSDSSSRRAVRRGGPLTGSYIFGKDPQELALIQKVYNVDPVALVESFRAEIASQKSESAARNMGALTVYDALARSGALPDMGALGGGESQHWAVVVAENTEKKTCAFLESQATYLPPVVTPSGLRVPRVVKATHIFKKQTYFNPVTQKDSVKTIRMDASGGIMGGLVIVTCVMDDKMYEVISSSPVVLGFVHKRQIGLHSLPAPMDEAFTDKIAQWMTDRTDHGEILTRQLAEEREAPVSEEEGVGGGRDRVGETVARARREAEFKKKDFRDNGVDHWREDKELRAARKSTPDMDAQNDPRWYSGEALDTAGSGSDTAFGRRGASPGGRREYGGRDREEGGERRGRASLGKFRDAARGLQDRRDEPRERGAWSDRSDRFDRSDRYEDRGSRSFDRDRPDRPQRDWSAPRGPRRDALSDRDPIPTLDGDSGAFGFGAGAADPDRIPTSAADLAALDPIPAPAAEAGIESELEPRTSRFDGERPARTDREGGFRRERPDFGGDREGGFRRERPEGGFRRERSDFGGDREGGFRRERSDYGADREGGFRRERSEGGEREGGFRRERSEYGAERGDREGGFRPRERSDFGDREGGFRRERSDFGGDREGGFRRERSEFGADREGGFRRERSEGGDREGGFRPREPRGDFGGDRFADRDRGSRFGDRDRQGGDREGFRGRDRFDRNDRFDRSDRPRFGDRGDRDRDRAPSGRRSPSAGWSDGSSDKKPAEGRGWYGADSAPPMLDGGFGDVFPDVSLGVDALVGRDASPAQPLPDLANFSTGFAAPKARAADSAASAASAADFADPWGGPAFPAAPAAAPAAPTPAPAPAAPAADFSEAPSSGESEPKPRRSSSGSGGKFKSSDRVVFAGSGSAKFQGEATVLKAVGNMVHVKAVAHGDEQRILCSPEDLRKV